MHPGDSSDSQNPSNDDELLDTSQSGACGPSDISLEGYLAGPPNLVITGFMGTGKTSVGRVVAQRLDREFVDMDAEIEARAGKTVASIFAEDGESAFRGMERALVSELSTRTGLVIATGGGTLVDPVNARLMSRHGTIVCLTADPNEILERVTASGAPSRPLLDVPDPRAEVALLLAARYQAYATIPWQIDTTGLSVTEAAQRVQALADIVTLPVRFPGGSYQIHIGAGLLAHIGNALRASGVAQGSGVAIVTNSSVAPLYSAQVERSLSAAGLRAITCIIPDGERYKTLSTVAALYDHFLAGRLERGDTVLALGGGVTGDIAGFAAASYMRGVRFVQVPTTLLAMVDASVGGKTGIDLPQGKNLVGAFKQPALVLIDTTLLATLPEDELRSGMSEMLKHGIIGDAGLFARLETHHDTVDQHQQDSTDAGPLSASELARAIRVKIDIVEQDQYEQGQRAVLNLGHTVGHALEKLSGFSLRHGEAVAIGMVAATRIAVALGQADRSLIDRIERALTAWELPVRCPPFDIDAIRDAMAHDKKTHGQSPRWILPRDIGQVAIVEDIPYNIVKSVLSELGARSDT